MQPLLVCGQANSRRIRSFGPVIVTETTESDGPCKLYAFCKKSFPHISKSGLQKCFIAGSIMVNGKSVQCGHVEESRRLQLGDIIKIEIDLDAVDELIVNTTELNVLHIQKGYAILFKACGVSAAFDKELDKALKTRLWGGQRKTECQLLYHLEKGFSGICVVAENADHLLELRSLCCKNRIAESEDSIHDNDIAEISDSCRDILTDSRCDLGDDDSTLLPRHHPCRFPATSQQKPFLELTHRCIICGKIGYVGELVMLATGHSDYQVIEAKVLQISRCRSKGFISLIDIRVTFDEAPMGVTNDKKNNNYGSCICSSDSEIVDEDHDAEELDNCDECGTSVSVEPDSEHSASMALTTFTVEKIKRPQTAADYRFLHYPTLRLRSIKRALSLCGHQIVGDGGAVKSAKGIYAAVVSVTIYNPDNGMVSLSASSTSPTSEGLSCVSSIDVTASSSAPFTVSVEDPKKFAKLMLKEQEMWELAEARDQELLKAWGSQCTERNLELGLMKELSIMDRRASASSNVDPLLPVEEQSERISSFCSNHKDNNIFNTSSTTTKSSKSYSSLADMRTALASGMPIEYVLGEAAFCGLRYMVSPAVMVPRKSSEVLVNEALRVISDIILPTLSSRDCPRLEVVTGNQGASVGIHTPLAEQEIQAGLEVINEFKTGPKLLTLNVLDIGTGSGCLLLSCMKIFMEQQKVKNSSQILTDYKESEFKIQGLGIDLSPEALQVASDNSTALGLEENTDFKVLDFGNLSALVSGPTGPQCVSSWCKSDISSQSVSETNYDQKQIAEEESLILNPPIEGPAEGLQDDQEIPPRKIQGPFDVILCNPPYSSRRDTTRLSVACREHEPSLALFAPDGPLAAYRVLASSLIAAEEKREQNKKCMQNGNPIQKNATGCEEGLFKSNGHLFLEVGHGQHLPVQKIFSKLPFLSFVTGAKDHKGIDRCLVYKYWGDKLSNHAYYYRTSLLLRTKALSFIR